MVLLTAAPCTRGAAVAPLPEPALQNGRTCTCALTAYPVPLTLVVSLSRPVRDFPSPLLDPATWAFPPQLAATAAARAAYERAPVGAGPFQVESIVHSQRPAGRAPVPGEVVLTPNPGYFG